MADERGSVVVRESVIASEGRQVQFWFENFYFLIRQTLCYQLKNLLSVLKMATTVYESETCDASVSNKGSFCIFLRNKFNVSSSLRD